MSSSDPGSTQPAALSPCPLQQEVSEMAHRTPAALVTALLLLAPATSHALSPYAQNFDGLNKNLPTALSANGWLVYGNVYDPTGTTFIRGYGAFPAPNKTVNPAFCNIAAGEGGTEQGTQQLNVFSDYENTDHNPIIGNRIESLVFQEQPILAGDVGTRWVFLFDAKLGNLGGSSTASAFIKTLDPLNGYATTSFQQREMTSIPTTWGTYWLAITIEAGMVGQIVQFGFLNWASNYEPSAVFYDNVSWAINNTLDVTGPVGRDGIELLAAAPTPFTHSTRIAYSIARRGAVDLSVYDVTGRRIAVLFRGVAEPGSHRAVWDGRSSDGRLAPAGVYRYVLKTAEGRKARSTVLNR
jgi:hypothetical protein